MMIRWCQLVVVLLSCSWSVLACPERCSCYHEQGLYVANCSSLPYSGGKVEALNLLPSSRTPIELNDGQFNAIRHLKYLNLRNSSIYIIHKKTFYGARNLIEIDLSFNFIEEIEPTVFQHLTVLTTLILRGNPIHFVSDIPFLISNSLQHLDIGQCKIRSVPRETFYGLKRLKYLSMDGNLLGSLKYNSLPKDLKYINLSNNIIVNVPTEVISSLPKLRRIGLGGNPINCSCSLMNLQDWLSGKGVIFEGDVICELPLEYKGLSWNRVNENRLCLAEARREEIYRLSAYNPLTKTRLHKGGYFENENSNMREYLQSDQPQASDLNHEAKTLDNDNVTKAHSSLARDEEGHQLTLDTNIKVVIDPKLDNANITDAEEVVNLKESADSKTETTTEGSENTLSKTENVKNSDSEDSVPVSSVDLVGAKDISNENITEIIDDSLKLEGESTSLQSTEAVNMNESYPVEYKTLNYEESNTEVDDFKKEGLFHVDSNEYSMDTNNTSGESTVMPEMDETTDEEQLYPTEETLIIKDDNSNLENSFTSTSEASNCTNVDECSSNEEEVLETVPTSIVVSEISSTNQKENISTESVVPETEDQFTNQENSESNATSLITAKSSDSEAEKIKEVAGAEVVIFCVGVLVICLVLFSIYKCRTSKNRQNTRTIKDSESNRETEMQDMASLLPKPQENDKKNNLKYSEKAPSSETVKLISDSNEKETPTLDSKTMIEDKNSLNNNRPSSPTSKTPLIETGRPVKIVPAAPIQRTKAKVGIIPDSIPQTPIFLQKTYNGKTNL